jgi:hypothetical protein
MQSLVHIGNAYKTTYKDGHLGNLEAALFALSLGSGVDLINMQPWRALENPLLPRSLELTGLSFSFSHFRSVSNYWLFGSQVG